MQTTTTYYYFNLSAVEAAKVVVEVVESHDGGVRERLLLKAS